MTAQEVRIGNYYDHNGEVKQVTPNTIEELWNAPRQWCKPIPLTEDWLKRFGFEEAANGFWCPKDLLNVKISKHQIISIYLAGSDTDLAFIGIQYVHQLQNLYFALKQTELTPSDGGKIE